MNERVSLEEEREWFKKGVAMAEEQKGFVPTPMETKNETGSVGVTSAEAAPQSPYGKMPTSSSGPTKPKKGWSRKKKVIVTIVAVIVLFAMIGSCGGNSSNSKDSQSTAATTQETASTENKETQAPEEKKVDKSALEAVIGQYESTDASAYTAETYQAFADAMSQAQTVDANEGATQSEVDSARKNLLSAYGALKEAFKPENYQSPAYIDVARNPDSFKGQKVAFTGKVLQVLEGTTETDLRIATDGGYDDVVFVGFDPSILGGIHVLEDDSVTVYGTCIGQYTYTSALGSSISLPGLYADQVVIN